MRKPLKEVLMHSYDMTSTEADLAIEVAKADFDDFIATGDFASADEVLSDHFGLEPDYLDEFL